MHPIQIHILRKLTLGEALRFSELKPKDAESNLFMYHLKKLVGQGFIKKSGGKYVLTAAGHRHVDKLSLASFRPRFQPKIVTVIICRNPKGEHLLYKRKRQPFYGLFAFPYGKVHFGETVARAALRELKEKTGLSARLAHRGEAYLTIYNKEKELLAHMLCHVFTGDRPAGALRAETEVGSSEWGRVSEAGRGAFIPGFLEIFTLATKSKSPFFKEFTECG